MKKLMCLFVALMAISVISFATDTTKTVPAAITVVQPVVEKACADSTTAWQKELIGNILGDKLTWVGYVSAVFFVLLGLFIRGYVKTKIAIKNDVTTPAKWSWAYWWRRNLVPKLTTIALNMVVIFLALRFSTEIMGLPVSMLLAVAIGIGFDIVLDKITKLKLPVKLNLPTNPPAQP